MSQVGYGKSDAIGAPFDFYAGVNATIPAAVTMQSARLVVAATTSPLAALAITLPLNPPDGCVAEISSTTVITAISVAANTGDSIVAGLLGALGATFTPVASTGAGGATATLRYAYALNGYQAGSNGVIVGARSWTRIQ